MKPTVHIPMSVILQATAIAGVLDLLSAFVYALLEGRNALIVPIGIASAIWPGAKSSPGAAIVVGVLLHFAIMLVMVYVFALAVRFWSKLASQPVLAGAAYGLLLWATMYLVVLPLRWPTVFPHFTGTGVMEQMFSHVVLVGMPVAWLIGNSAKAACLGVPAHE
ncbi:hypothetical protein [Dyella kyungheensis]|uniref:DUF1440 domain-containing protein n=1 Tax=Dyella kyungheensis TaxID=1242174 RepID=A0ABS2JNI7_9GAMM|nr:hypothetical protein [Dyella kyungheensis]MBM7119770.1 hypothetical protein [Dyella kyungheensis]